MTCDCYRVLQSCDNNVRDNSSATSQHPLVSEPDQVIRGGPSIRSYNIQNDKRHIVTRDTEGGVAVYDVLKACKVEDLGNVDFDQAVEERQQTVYVPNWFTVDLKTGMLTIHLGQVTDQSLVNIKYLHQSCVRMKMTVCQLGLVPEKLDLLPMNLNRR